MDLQHFPVGTRLNCYFAFLARKLTSAERLTFLNDTTLPALAGQDQPQAFAEYFEADNPVQTFSGAEVVRVDVGIYRVIIITTTPGLAKYRGYSLDAGEQPLASTEWQYFIVDS